MSATAAVRLGMMTFGLLGSASLAPMQCGQGSESVRLEDDPGEALWTLATRFEQEGNHAAAVETWRYLADRYPSNRHATEAKHLGGDSRADGDRSASAGGHDGG